MGVTIEVFAPFTLSGALDAPCGRYLRLRVLLVFHPSDVTIKVAGTTDVTSGKFLPAFSSI